MTVNSHSVLVSDRNVNIIRALQRLLKSAGYIGDAAPDAATSKDLLDCRPYRAVVADDMGVLQMAAEIQPWTQRILLVSDLNLVRTSSERHTAHHVLLKPWDNRKLIHMIGQDVSSTRTPLA